MSTAGWQEAVSLLQQGQAPQAEQLLRQVATADPYCFEGQLYLGIALAQQGRHQEAVGPLSAAANIRPDHAGARYNLAVMLQHTNDVPGAEQQYQAALQLDPNHAKARQALQALPARRPAGPTPQAPAPAPRVPGLARSLESRPSTSDEPYYTDEELKAADRAEVRVQWLVRGSVLLAWGIGLAALFVAFSNVMSIFFGIVIVAPILGPLIYLVAMDGREWFSESPKLAIPVAAAGLVFSLIAVLWVHSKGALQF